MILGDVEETVTTVVIDDETYEEIYKVMHVQYWVDLIFVICHVTKLDLTQCRFLSNIPFAVQKR